MAVFTAEMRELAKQMIRTITGFEVSGRILWGQVKAKSLTHGTHVLHIRFNIVNWEIHLRQSLPTLTALPTGACTQYTEDNFKLCFQFAKSNFKFHRFLDVNDLNVTRSIKG